MKIRRDDYYVSKTRRWKTRAAAFLIIAVLIVPIMHRLLAEVSGNSVVTGKVMNISDDYAVIEYNASNDFDEVVYRSAKLERDSVPLIFFKGQSVVLLMPDRDIDSAFQSPFGIIASSVCVAAAVSCFAVYIKWNRRRKENGIQIKEVLTNGERINCSIDNIEKTDKVGHSFAITLSGTDRFGNLRTFRSDTLYFDPTKFLRGKESLDVYFDRGDSERYVISYPDDFPTNAYFNYY